MCIRGTTVPSSVLSTTLYIHNKQRAHIHNDLLNRRRLRDAPLRLAPYVVRHHVLLIHKMNVLGLHGIEVANANELLTKSRCRFPNGFSVQRTILLQLVEITNGNKKKEVLGEATGVGVHHKIEQTPYKRGFQVVPTHVPSSESQLGVLGLADT